MTELDLGFFAWTIAGGILSTLGYPLVCEWWQSLDEDPPRYVEGVFGGVLSFLHFVVGWVLCGSNYQLMILYLWLSLGMAGCAVWWWDEIRRGGFAFLIIAACCIAMGPCGPFFMIWALKDAFKYPRSDEVAIYLQKT